MRLRMLLFLFVLSVISLRAQEEDPLPIWKTNDTVVTYLHQMGEVLFTHRVQPGQTLYSLAKFYGLTLQELYAYNPHVSAHYENGDLLHIPLPLKAILRQDIPPKMRDGLAIVYYRVQRGDTVYGITKRTFEISNEWLLSQNPALVNGLKPGQVLRIGWVSTLGIPSEWREIRGGPYALLNHPLKLDYFRRSADRRITEERGAATWPRDQNDNSGFYCLHRTAPINGLVEVYNPLTRQTMYLKVSARLPERVYDRSTVVVVSPLAAKALGVKDDRFYVHLKHY